MKESALLRPPELPKLPEAALIRPFTGSRRDVGAIKRLDVQIDYARSPAPGKEQSYGTMTPVERASWVEGDEDHHLVAICATGDKDPTKPVGFVYRYKEDVDSNAREPHVRAMANLPEEAELWELNFDAPKRRDYMKLVESGVRQELANFFSEGDAPKAVVYYAEVDDMVDDGAILQKLGGKIIGKINYDHPEKIRGKKDTVILITREDLERTLEGKAKTLDRSEAGTPAALVALELRAKQEDVSNSALTDVLLKHYQGDPFDKLPESFRSRIDVALQGMKGSSLIDVQDVTGGDVKNVEQALEHYTDILVTHLGAPHHTYHKVIGPDGEVRIYRVGTLPGDQLTWGGQKSVAEIVAEKMGLKKNELDEIAGTTSFVKGHEYYYGAAGPWYGKKPTLSKGA